MDLSPHVATDFAGVMKVTNQLTLKSGDDLRLAGQAGRAHSCGPPGKSSGRPCRDLPPGRGRDTRCCRRLTPRRTSEPQPTLPWPGQTLDP